MNNRTTTQVLAISAAIISSLCIYSSKADAQYNGSNSSGSNTTSYNGSSSSIWNSNRKETPVQKLIPPVSVDRPNSKIVPTTVLVKPVVKPVAIDCTTDLGDEVNCPTKPVVKPVYRKAVKQAPRGRG